MGKPLKEFRHESKKCGGRYETLQSDAGVPFLVCENCGHKVDDWIKWEAEYQLYHGNPEMWKSKKNHLVCLLGLFADLYKKHYSVNFAFSLNDKGLFRGIEAVQMRKLYHNCNSDADFAASYIKWVFAKKVVEKKRKISSLGFLNVPATLNEFKLSVVASKKIGRSTPLPPKMSAWFSQNLPDLNVRDFGDLRSILEHVKRGSIEKDEAVAAMIEKLKSCGAVDECLNISRWSE